MRHLRSAFLVAALALSMAVTTQTQSAEPVRFNRDVRPILSDKCFFCHGPDANKREADLRLDVREVAVKEGAIKPGKPAESGLILRVESTNPKNHMPPKKSKLPDLTPAEIATLRQWIAEGAEYESHWAFIPLTTPQIKSLDTAVEKGLAARGLKPQAEADRNTLVRRVSFDLTGLPPTPAEVDAFIRDDAPNAYEKLVDRLLASPRYGERMAVDWLDVSRYADSYGFQQDWERNVWPWRDWVIRSFNENLAFDKFITWQLAGDLLPNATENQILATAFNRLHQQENEGGSVLEEYRVEYVCDRVQTFSTAFLGLTFECARCHDHKFDPISQKEFYQLFSMFQNIDEAGVYSFYTKSTPTPALDIPDAAGKKRLADLQEAVKAEEVKLAAIQAAPENQGDGFNAWLATKPQSVQLADEIGSYSFDALDKGKLANRADAKTPATLHGSNKIVPGRAANAVEFTGDDPVTLPFGNYSSSHPFSVALWLKTPDKKERAVVFHRSKSWTDAASRGYELLIENGKLKWSLIHFWPGNAISIRAQSELQINQWAHVVVSSDGSSRAAGLKLYVNGRLAPIEIVKDALTRNITGGGGDNIALAERDRDRGFKGGSIDEFRVISRELTALEALATFDEAAATALLTKGTDARVKEYYLATANPAIKTQLAALKKAREGLVGFVDGVRDIMVMRELPQPKKSYTLVRGQYDQHKDEVGPGVPDWLMPMPANAPKNRLGLAHWLTDPKHPLTARVLVNRFWQSIFGRGLVKTSEDFGSQGTRPLYPEVLDLLAYQFIHNGWDSKALIKTIVMSGTYRQKSIANAKTMADDPDNEWLARGPRFRLSAEMIRDNALAATGLLSEKIGGAPVNPYEMSEAFKPVGASGGDGVYRRSIYTNWRRTAPPPALLAFDAPRRGVCSAKRERTDSPLQALILLNGTQYVEAARVLGEKLHLEAKGDVALMIENGFMRCLSRKPDEKETAILRQLYDEQLAYFKAKPDEAAKISKIGHAKPAAGMTPPEAAAAMVLGQALLNHDACIVKR